MNLNLNGEVPIYMQIAHQIEEAIFVGSYEEETQIPSTTELSTILKINPATVLKGMNLLVDNKILYKKRGVGMFVCEGAVEAIKDKRQSEFYDNFVVSLVSEAKKLNINKDGIIKLIERGFKNDNKDK